MVYISLYIITYLDCIFFLCEIYLLRSLGNYQFFLFIHSKDNSYLFTKPNHHAQLLKLSESVSLLLHLIKEVTAVWTFCFPWKGSANIYLNFDGRDFCQNTNFYENYWDRTGQIALTKMDKRLKDIVSWIFLNQFEY